MFAKSRWKMLNLTWVSFFLTFVVWFNLAPFTTSIARSLKLTKEQVTTLMLCNVALTIPARIAVGMLVDRFGPRRVFTAILLIFSIPCVTCAMATEYWQLVVSRLLVSCIGAGFVVGIRLVGEWFDAREIGLAEGIYGGLGNFGMAAATFGLPGLALAWGGENGWRFAMLVSGAACVLWAFVFYRHIENTPPGKRFRVPSKSGALHVSSRGGLMGLCFMQVPLVFCLGIIAWKLTKVHLLPVWGSYVVYAGLAALLGQQVSKILKVNKAVLKGVGEPEHRYAFGQVAILSLSYAVTFGGELAIESMLPAHFEKMFGLSVAKAGFMGSLIAIISTIVARPLGGYLGDKLGRRPVMLASMGGAAVGLVGLGFIGSHWSLWSAGIWVVVAGLFLMAGNGANFCIVPLIRKPLTGQIAGLVGAYGSVGSVLFLTVYALFGPGVFFTSMSVTACVAFACCFFLKEPLEHAADETAPVTTPVFGHAAMA